MNEPEDFVPENLRPLRLPSQKNQPSGLHVAGLVVGIGLTLLALAILFLNAEPTNLGYGILICIGIPIYFIPSFVASHRGHHNVTAIVALNILLGWTFIGWAVALVWALTEPRRSSTP